MRMRRDKRGPFDPDDTEELIEGRRSWEQRLLVQWMFERGLIFGLPLGREAIRENAGAVTICCPQALNILPELCYDGPLCPLIIVLSRSGPFNLDMALTSSRLQQWLWMYYCRDYHQVHVSGHSPMEDLAAIIGAAQPKTLIPIHTRHPEAFVPLHGRVEYGIDLGKPVVIV